MNKVERYYQELQTLEDWDTFLLAESGLPGRRANIELAQAVAEAGDAPLFDRYRAYDARLAPANTPGEFLAFCGVLGLGRLAAAGERPLSSLRPHANDPRWRVREAVAMALQRCGQVDMNWLLEEMATWSQGSCLEQRAAAAGLCAPGLLADPEACAQTLAILDRLTAQIAQTSDRRHEDFQALRKGLGYCWSVAIAACPPAGKPAFERWLDSEDVDVRWLLRANLKKKRLERVDAAWVAECLEKI